MFNGEYYDRWYVQMTFIFKIQDVLEIINDGLYALEANATETHNIIHHEVSNKDENNLFFIYQCVDPNTFENIIKELMANNELDITQEIVGR